MTRFETLIFLEFLMPIVLAISIFLLQRAISKRLEKQEKESKERAELRQDYDTVTGDMAEAAMELAYATSVAVEQGKTNGEMKKARELYDDARKERDAFLKKVKKEVIK